MVSRWITPWPLLPKVPVRFSLSLRWAFLVLVYKTFCLLMFDSVDPPSIAKGEEPDGFIRVPFDTGVSFEFLALFTVEGFCLKDSSMMNSVSFLGFVPLGLLGINSFVFRRFKNWSWAALGYLAPLLRLRAPFEESGFSSASLICFLVPLLD